jgi:ketosteroid isomerase-like protein
VSTEASKQIVQQYFDHLAAGDARGAFSLLAPDVTYRLIGSTPISHEARGMGELLDRILRPFTSRLQGGRIDMVLDNLIAEGDRVVALAHSKATGQTGLPYENTYAMVFTLAGDRIASVLEYLDTALVETAVFGKKLVDPGA